MTQSKSSIDTHYFSCYKASIFWW